MKKYLFSITAVLFLIFLASCGSDDGNGDSSNNNDDKEIDELNIGFVPSREPDEITTATEPLKDMLKDQLAEEGYEVDEVDINVGTDYEAVGEALSAGSTDIGFIPGGTYVLFDDDADVLLSSTRAGLSIDSEDPKDWNDNKPTEPEDEQVTYYKALAIAGPSDKGQELAEKVNNGDELSWDDLNSANWSVMSTSSSAGYIYPTLWLKDEFDGNDITDLDHVSTSDSYGSSVARLAAGQTDIMVGYADVRRDYEDDWESTYERDDSIWDETNVIGVTPDIYNDTISVAKEENNPKMTDDLKSALTDAFIDIAETEEGKEVIDIYQHEGYEEADSSDYDAEREAQEVIQEMED